MRRRSPALRWGSQSVRELMLLSSLPASYWLAWLVLVNSIGAFLLLNTMLKNAAASRVTTLFFVTDQHWEVLRGLVASYTAMPIEQPFATDFSLAQMADAMSEAFMLTMQISAPFIIYGISINFLFGVAAKLTPQIAIYFVSTPFVMTGGILLLYFVISDFMRLFMAGFMKWLTNG